MKQKFTKELKNRLTIAKEKLSTLEDRLIEIMQSEEQGDKNLKRNEQNLRDLWITLSILTNI